MNERFFSDFGEKVPKVWRYFRSDWNNLILLWSAIPSKVMFSTELFEEQERFSRMFGISHKLCWFYFQVFHRPSPVPAQCERRFLYDEIWLHVIIITGIPYLLSNVQRIAWKHRTHGSPFDYNTRKNCQLSK